MSAVKRIQLIVNISEEFRQQIKIAAVLSGKTMREWVLEACEEKLAREKKTK
jgi:uncharacterized protein (DUF1778 family)